MDKRRNLSTPVQLLLVAGLVTAALVMCSILLGVATMAGVLDMNSSLHMLLMMIVQDVLVFIVPSVVAVAVIYRQPLRVMQLNCAPSWAAVAFVIVACAVSLPAMNAITTWNQGLHLPQSFSGLEQALRASEDAAAALTEKLLAVDSVPMLLLSLLVVGFMAGLSEEMLFRGTLVRLWQLGERTREHVVVWVIAILFSAIHMQFFGFVPRMLLGAYLGYLLLWTRSLWVPIVAHTLNNSVVVLANYLAVKGVIAKDAADNLGVAPPGQFPWLAVVSGVATLALLWWGRKYFVRNRADV